MKILLINTHHKIIGGAERYYFDLSRLLRSKGCEVAYFSMLNNGNKNTKWKKYFIENINLEKSGIENAIRKILRIFYSLEAKEKIARLLDDFKPDIIHINNIYYYISPSILGEIKKRKIPIVQTVHDYQLISPNVSLFYKGKVCEVTKKDRYYKALLDRSVIESYVASLSAIVASYVQHIFKFYENNVDVFIAPSKFMHNKLREYDFNAKEIINLDNFVFLPKPIERTSVKNKYILFFGRLSEAKGILMLLKTAEKLPKINFKIVGNFESKSIRTRTMNEVKEEKINNVKFLGFKNRNEINELISQSQFVVVPSLWYELHPYTILESFAMGKTVIASNMGGIPEIVRNNKNGLLFEPGNVDDFVTKIIKLWENPKLMKRLGNNAEKLVKKKYNPEVYYIKIIELYRRLTK